MLFILASATAGAQDTGLSVPQMTARAGFIGIATVTSSEVRQNQTNGMIYTHYVLEIAEAWKGTPLQPAELMQAGGELDGKVAAIVGHEYKLVPGQTIVLFATISKLGNYVVMGLRQGLYEVGAGPEHPVHRLSMPRETGPSAPGLTVAALKKEVFDVLGLPYEPPVLPAPAPGKAPASVKPSGKTGDAPEDVPRPPAPARPQIPVDPPGPNWAMVAAGAAVAAAVVGLLLSMKRRRSPSD